MMYMLTNTPLTKVYKTPEELADYLNTLTDGISGRLAEMIDSHIRCMPDSAIVKLNNELAYIRGEALMIYPIADIEPFYAENPFKSFKEFLLGIHNLSEDTKYFMDNPVMEIYCYDKLSDIPHLTGNDDSDLMPITDTLLDILDSMAASGGSDDIISLVKKLYYYSE